MNHQKKEPRKDPNALRITNQFRAEHGMVYELKRERDKLIVRVFGRANSKDPADWRIEARISDAAEATVVTEWAATKAEALQKIGSAWTTLAFEQGLPTFDWVNVAEVLHAVRAV